jgi:hypothetical protein
MNATKQRKARGNPMGGNELIIRDREYLIKYPSKVRTVPVDARQG